jgi:hypothetical protein
MLEKNKKLIIGIVLILASFFVYSRFFGPNSDRQLGLIQSGPAISSTEVLGTEIIRAINQINSLTLDKSVFTDPVFQTLIDRSQPIESEPRGRNNPFAPLGNVQNTSTQQSSQTLN